MYKNRTFLAIIPARGGSKRLPRKNILELDGKPLIAWSIEAGVKSKYMDKVVVTSDNEEILDISKLYGVQGIKRPNKLASDTATTFDAIKHTMDNIERNDYIVLLQPTSQLRNYKHIDEAIELLETKNADAVASVCKMEHSSLWSNTLPQDLSMNNFLKDEILNKRSQDLEKFFIVDKIFAYKMDRNSSVDIDEEMDFYIAKEILDGR